jgi:hypothetical protein
MPEPSIPYCGCRPISAQTTASVEFTRAAGHHQHPDTCFLHRRAQITSIQTLAIYTESPLSNNQIVRLTHQAILPTPTSTTTRSNPKARQLKHRQDILLNVLVSHATNPADLNRNEPIITITPITAHKMIPGSKQCPKIQRHHQN